MKLYLETKIIEIDRKDPPLVVNDEGVTYCWSFKLWGADAHQYREATVLDTSTLS